MLDKENRTLPGSTARRHGSCEPVLVDTAYLKGSTREADVPLHIVAERRTLLEASARIHGASVDRVYMMFRGVATKGIRDRGLCICMFKDITEQCGGRAAVRGPQVAHSLDGLAVERAKILDSFRACFMSWARARSTAGALVFFWSHLHE